MLALGLKMKAEALGDAFKTLDIEQKGYVSFEECVEWFLLRKGIPRETKSAHQLKVQRYATE